jgi:alcohol dehydrogenase
MKAAILKSFGTPLAIDTLPDLHLNAGTGEVIVDVLAAPVLPYSAEVFSGQRQYLLKLPVAPGCGAVGRVRAFGPDATHLAVGDWVFCDPTVRSRDDAQAPDVTLQGLSARGDGGLRLQSYFNHGSFAAQMRVPTENAIRLGPIDAADAGRWCAMGTLLVPYGGLLAGKLRAGETLLVSGATGHFGSAAVAVALGMGAGCVVAPGRNGAMLADLVRRFGPRVRPVKLTGHEAADTAHMREAAPGRIDCVLDILPPSAPAAAARAAIMAVRQEGRVVLMGGVGMLGGAALELPYPWIMRQGITIRGQWMLQPGAATSLAALVRGGLVDLNHFGITAFALDAANEAVAHAAADAGAFRLTVIQP